MKYDKIKQEVFEANMKLQEFNLVIFTFGNASAVDRDNGVFAIKPSGVPYEQLTPNNMVVVDFEGNVVEGDARPSSDTLTHAVLYKQWKGIGGIVHTHSTYATSWAQAQMDIPIYGTTHADHLIFDIPCTPVMSDEMIKGNYEYQTGFQIINCFKDKHLTPDEVQMAIIANHGPFTWGKDSTQAVYNSAILEELAKMAWLTKSISPEAKRLKESLRNKHYERKHGKNSYYGQE